MRGAGLVGSGAGGAAGGAEEGPIVTDKADRFLALVEALRSMSPEERQRTIDDGKRDPAPKVRLFFECLERELAELERAKGPS